jgi:4-phytase/acid phosphatase/peptide/nickel transport system substrate-binding protein
MPTIRRRGAFFVIAVILAALLGAPAAGAQTRGGKVTLGVEQDIAGFDPLIVGVYDTGQEAMASLVFDTLTRLDANGKPVPRLALSWTHSADFKTWTFKLRPNVKFQDSSPFNAAAVAFNYQRMLDPNNHCRCLFYISTIASVEAADPLTAVFHLRTPAPNWPAVIAVSTVTNVIHSPQAITTMKEAYNRHPVGTGPFRLKSWQSGDRIVLERNPDYWNPGRPYLDEVIIRPMPDNTARFASVEAGETDIIWTDRAEDILSAKKNPRLAVHEYSGSGAQVYAFNTKVAPFDDLRVRQALRMALDLKTFAQAEGGGLWQPAKDPYGPGSFVQCKDPGTPPYDPEKAKALLKAYGKPVDFKMVVTATPRGREIGQIFQEMWHKVGANMTIDQIDQTALVTKAFRRDFQLTPWRIIDLADPDVQMYANFHSGSPLNLAGYSNPEVDRLLDDARSTADEEKRVAAYCAIARILNRDVPWFWTVDNHYFSIAKPELKGVAKQFSDIIDVSAAYWEKK